MVLLYLEGDTVQDYALAVEDKRYYAMVLHVRLEYVWNTFGRAAVAPHPFVDILTGTPKVSGSTATTAGVGGRMAA